MRSHGSVGVVSAFVVTLLVMIGVIFCGLPAGAAEPGSVKPVGAKIVGLAGRVEVRTAGEAPRVIKSGDLVYLNEEMIVDRGSTLTLAMSDRTLREFAGPATLSIGLDPGKAGGKVLANLSQAIADMLFRSLDQTGEAIMATRAVESGTEQSSAVPTLVYPAAGERLVEAPREFRWRGVQDVPLYRVSVYSSQEMMWQGTVSGSKVACPAKTCSFKPDETYYWVVEALIGNTSLRSPAADFKVLSGDTRTRIDKALSDADTSVSDANQSLAVKIRLCLDSGVYSRALEIANSHIQQSPSRASYLLRAEISEAMGLWEDAVGDYRRAAESPSE